MTDLAEFPAPQLAVAGFSTMRRIRSAFAGLPPSVVVGLLLLLFWVACAIAGNLFVPYDPYAEDFLATLTPPDA
ncbi:ABC transporter permease, partial [Mesorhizobium sp. M7A.F.Ca.US.005.03.2.1]